MKEYLSKLFQKNWKSILISSIDGFKNMKKYGERAFPGRESHEFIRKNEITRLEKENKRLKEEVELLKSSKSS